MKNIQIIPYTDSYQDSYLSFARTHWGEKEYQADPKYLCWLYKEHPFSEKSLSDCKIAVTDDKKVIGAVHKMPLLWGHRGEIVRVAAMHNLMVARAYRKGVGLKLLSSALAEEEDALILGVQLPLADFYEKVLKCQRVESRWYWAILSPLHVLYCQGRYKMMGIKPEYLSYDADLLEKKRVYERFPNYLMTFDPEDKLLEGLSSRLNENGGLTHINWTPDLCRWRFFHPLGPKHLLFSQGSRPENFLIISLGIWKAQHVARIVEISAISGQALADLINVAKKVLRFLGVGVLLAFCANEKIQEFLSVTGLRPLKKPPRTYFYHRHRGNRFSSFAFNGSGGDYGFEAILTQLARK